MTDRVLAAALISWALVSSVGLAPLAAAVRGGETTVVVEAGQSARDLAAIHLGDPDLWPELLRQNGLGSADEVRPGMRLTIVRDPVSLAAGELSASREAIERAVVAGARVLAAEVLDRALGLRDEALVARRAGEWERCRALAREARGGAEEAFGLASRRRQVAAEALLADRQGRVEARGASELVWRDAPRGSRLAEGQKVRTLSGSLAEIRFPDQTRLRLGESSQAVIRTLERDVLSRGTRSKVLLEGGDLQAVVGSRRRGQSFGLAIPGVEVRTESTLFWASRRQDDVRVANYEEAEIEISSADSTLKLGKNQGTVVRKGGGLGEVRDLLPAPRGLRPAGQPVAFQGEIELGWQPVEGAAAYWLEVSAGSSSFEEIVLSRTDLGEPVFHLGGEPRLASGLQYWRVAAVDVEGLPGPKSETASFQVVFDRTPPYLAVDSPRPGQAVAADSVEVVGRLESGAALTVDGQEVEPAPGGRFRYRVPLENEGPREIAVEARDEAGLVSRREILVERLRPGAPEVRLEPESERFTTRGPDFLLRGSTWPRTAVSAAFDTAGARPLAGAYAGDDGSFELRLPLGPGTTRFVLDAVSAAGRHAERRFAVELDTSPPEELEHHREQER